MHIFSFTPSVDLFPNVLSQTDASASYDDTTLSGWSLERISPNTVHVTLIEQIHSRHPAAKSTLSGMLVAMSGLGESAIKTGGPPVISRLNGAKIVTAKYDVDTGTSKFVYEPAAIRTISTQTTLSAPGADNATESQRQRPGVEVQSIAYEEKPNVIECQIRCDPERWGSCLDIVVDPPPSVFSALRRHSLSENGGLWLSLEHNIIGPAASQRIQISVKAMVGAGAGKDKLMLNGREIGVDRVDIDSVELAALKRQKRAPVNRHSLDQPATMPVLRRRTTGLPPQRNDQVEAEVVEEEEEEPKPKPLPIPSTWVGSVGGWFGSAASGAKSVLVPVQRSATASSQNHPSNAIAAALEQLVKIHLDRFSESTTADDQWIMASRSGDAIVEKKILPFVSTNLPVYRSSRIIQGAASAEISAIISSDSHRQMWDAAKLSTVRTICSFGDGIEVQSSTVKMAFPYKQRVFNTVRMVAKAELNGQNSPSPNFAISQDSSLTFHVATSLFDAAELGLDQKALMPPGYAAGSVVLEGWILETLDPYSHDQFQIPSTRCMHVVAIDFGIPAAMNGIANANLPYRILAVEKLLDSSRRMPILLTPPSGVLLPKALFKRKEPTGRNSYARTLGRTSLISLIREPSGGFSAKSYIWPSGDVSRKSAFPAEWYDRDSIPESLDNTEQQNLKSSPSHLRTPSTWSRLVRNRSSSQRIVRGLSESSGAGTAEDLVEPLFQAILESSIEGEKYEVQLVGSVAGSEVLPMQIESEDQSLSSDLPLQIEITKIAPLVLRGALTDAVTYLIKISADNRRHTEDPLSGIPPVPLAQNRWQDVREKGAILQVKVLKLAQEGGSGVSFIHNGAPVEIRDHLAAPSPSPRRQDDAKIRQWPVLRRYVERRSQTALLLI